MFLELREFNPIYLLPVHTILSKLNSLEFLKIYDCTHPQYLYLYPIMEIYILNRLIDFFTWKLRYVVVVG